MREIAELPSRPQLYWPVHPSPRVRPIAHEILDGIPGVVLVDPIDYARDGRGGQGLHVRAHRFRRSSRGGAVSRQAGAGHARRNRTPRRPATPGRSSWSGITGSASSQRAPAARGSRRVRAHGAERRIPTATGTPRPASSLGSWLAFAALPSRSPSAARVSAAPKNEGRPAPDRCGRRLRRPTLLGLGAGILVDQRTGGQLYVIAGLFAGMLLGGYAAFRLLLRSME